MYRDVCTHLISKQRENGSFSGGRDTLTTCLATLTLLASRDQQYAPNIRRAVDWVLKSRPGSAVGSGFWDLSYMGIMLAEYHLASGDQRVLEWMQRTLEWLPQVTHTSKWGTLAFGHGAGGLPYGEKALIAPTTHILLFESLAKRCGIKSRVWESVYPYMLSAWSDPAKKGHGSMGYNASYKDKGEFWSRSGQFGAAAYLRNERPDMQEAIGKFMAGHSPWMRNSHAYGMPGAAWGLAGLAVINPQGCRKILNDWAWTFALAWEPGFGFRYSEAHMGAPYMGRDTLITASYGLVFAIRDKSLHMTGASERNWLKAVDQPGPLSTVEISRDQAGVVTLSAQIPAKEIRYTVDGSLPGPGTLLYKGPFVLPEGGPVQAVTVNAAAKSGPLSRAQLSAAAQVTVTLKGDKEAELSALVDGDVNSVWMSPALNFDKTYPLYFEFEFASPRLVASLHYTPGARGIAGRAIAECEISGTVDGQNWFDIVKGNFPEKGPKELHAEKARLVKKIRLKVVKTVNPKNLYCAIAELDFRGPQLKIERGADGITIGSSASGVELRYTLDASLPGKNSALYEKSFEAQGLVTARAFIGDTASAPQSRLFQCSSKGWKVIKTDSEENDARAANLIDGNPATTWHTRWRSKSTPHPHHVVIDLGRTEKLSALTYQSGSRGNTNGLVGKYEVFVSADGDSWGNAVAAGQFSYGRNQRAPQTAAFRQPASGRFIKFVAIDSVHRGQKWASGGEINLIPAVEVATRQPRTVAEIAAETEAAQKKTSEATEEQEKAEINKSMSKVADKAADYTLHMLISGILACSILLVVVIRMRG